MNMLVLVRSSAPLTTFTVLDATTGAPARSPSVTSRLATPARAAVYVAMYVLASPSALRTVP
eukprot:3880028-Pyramimonas_sp.AAC.1